MKLKNIKQIHSCNVLNNAEMKRTAGGYSNDDSYHVDSNETEKCRETCPEFTSNVTYMCKAYITKPMEAMLANLR